ncbi:DotU family type IV/VI secretion system protein [Sulfidibacter corallicola]|uniref:DotU family type IV/VI secretion system protein n=1 Tax=Sulfidibacter corallicola TaxID=2818388 RepID=A0A8A4TN36_SULCO|nr:DotU family type IV/VI secretion system protein [Sulfidibacter corallicola]QTD50963.1 DotU family type IV/VI secretion system protein [Sulfidibacter corallicola]
MHAENPSLLLQNLVAFYQLIATLKGQILRCDAEARDGTPTPSMAAPPSRKEVCDRLLLMLDRQASRSAGHPDSALGRQSREARYVMVALADEVFLHFAWAGRTEWNHYLLEEQVFHSQSAGEWFFQRVDDLLLDPGAGSRELAKVYLMALALGFKGRYRLGDPNGDLALYQRRLYGFIFGAEPPATQAALSLFPQNRETVAAQSDAQPLPRQRALHRLAAAILAAWLLLGFGLWRWLTRPVAEAARAILDLP